MIAREAATSSAIRTIVAATFAASIACIVSGCGHSAPTRYVTLNAIAPAAPLSTESMPPVQLSAVHIPAVLDRPEVVMRSAPNRLTIDDNERWGAPLAKMMRATLAQDLLARLPAGAFVFPESPAPPGTRRLVVTVLDCTTTTDGTLTLQVAWTLLSGQPERAIASDQTTLDARIDSRDAPAQAAALSRVLGELADRIAASLSAH